MFIKEPRSWPPQFHNCNVRFTVYFLVEHGGGWRWRGNKASNLRHLAGRGEEIGKTPRGHPMAVESIGSPEGRVLAVPVLFVT